MVITWSFRNTSGTGDNGSDGPYWQIGAHHDGLHQHYEESGLSNAVYGNGDYQVASNQDTYWDNGSSSGYDGMVGLKRVASTGSTRIWLR